MIAFLNLYYFDNAMFPFITKLKLTKNVESHLSLNNLQDKKLINSSSIVRQNLKGQSIINQLSGSYINSNLEMFH